LEDFGRVDEVVEDFDADGVLDIDEFIDDFGRTRWSPLEFRSFDGAADLHFSLISSRSLII
jgi:hypothetical protein